MGLDPRNGDFEDDASSTKSRSMLSLAGSLLVEISLSRLLIAWLLLVVLPAVVLGAAPIIVSAWLASVTTKLGLVAVEAGALALLVALLAGGWFAGRRLLPLAERSVWSLLALVVQPVYVACREVLRHLAERVLPVHAGSGTRAALRRAVAAFAGVLVSVLGVAVILLAWPFLHLFGGIPPVASPGELAVMVLANALALTSAGLAVAALAWGLADAMMGQKQDLAAFDAAPEGARRWRVAHLSDLHVVGERYGFRIESGRAGPRGNDRFIALLARLAALHEAAPLDLVLVTGDITDAGRSAEWAEFQDALAAHPALAARMLIVPGNHDVNIVDRANPARLDLPTSPTPRLRQIRMLAAMAALQGGRVHSGEATLAQALAPHRDTLAGFATTGQRRLRRGVAELWDAVFPLVLPPAEPDGLGVLILNSNAATHFSFTNALGLVTARQARGIDRALARWPRAVWIVALHHHLVEYPAPASALSERIGTVLINGNWVLRRLRRHARRIVVMHGHRHIDWIGSCGGIRIVSAPSPVMAKGDGFYVHTLANDGAGHVALLRPERIMP
ncbi:metallophosphoesterase [Rhodovastum atsumiense]|uniref:Metallophosphoesterase n=2 Tax=Rhodovastum atsumiense TaxID=504468 RepID=A0A5M6ISE7_9PROT|nr:metallophosphoesterase [Rhodovastum atsumiense]